VVHGLFLGRRCMFGGGLRSFFRMLQESEH
jgi:hypothetical protein